MRFISTVFFLICLAVPAFAGIDESINNFTAPIAAFVGQVVFFKISLFGAGLPLVVSGLSQVRFSLPFTWVL